VRNADWGADPTDPDSSLPEPCQGYECLGSLAEGMPPVAVASATYTPVGRRDAWLTAILGKGCDALESCLPGLLLENARLAALSFMTDPPFLLE